MDLDEKLSAEEIYEKLEITNVMASGRKKDSKRHGEDLLEWLEKGGFAPRPRNEGELQALELVKSIARGKGR